MFWVLLLTLTASLGQRISRAELPVKIGGRSGVEVELVGVSGGILTVETRQPGGQMFVRQMSNGHDLLILFYARKGELVACVKYQGPSPELNRFLNQYSNLTSVVQQGQDGTKFKDTDEVEFNWPPIDWNLAWKGCVLLQDAQREELLRIRHRPDVVRSPRTRRWTLLFPGTNWCGRGNASGEGGSTYGYFESTDRCCHQHDSCSVSIEPQQRKYNYFNNRSTTISHCDCDDDFRSCLSRVGDGISSLVGILYFNVLRMQCFTLVPHVRIHNATRFVINLHFISRNVTMLNHHHHHNCSLPTH